MRMVEMEDSPETLRKKCAELAQVSFGYSCQKESGLVFFFFLEKAKIHGFY